MKIKPIILLTFMAVAAISLSSSVFVNFDEGKQEKEVKKSEFGFPNDIDKVFTKSCYQCHTAGAKGEKALMKLNFSMWEQLSKAKKIHKLDEIGEEVSEGSMPPKKYLAKFPHKKLSKEEIKLIRNWVKTEGDQLMQ